MNPPRMVVFVAGILLGLTGTVVAQQFPLSFPDIVDGEYFAESVQRLVQKGILKGYHTGKFGPEDFVTRGQLAVVLDRFDRQIVGQLRDQVNALSKQVPQSGRSSMPPYSTEPKDQCDEDRRVGERYSASDGCNTCYCTETGTVCTTMACMPKGVPDQMSSDSSSTVSPPTRSGSCQEQKRELDSLFEKYRSCQTDTDCTMYIKACSPYLTCGKPVTKNMLLNIQRVVGVYEESCGQEEPVACAMCLRATASCAHGKCVLNEESVPPVERCSKYLRDGREEEHCATCGDAVCAPFESCTSSNCREGACTQDCGGLYCPMDCDSPIGESP